MIRKIRGPVIVVAFGTILAACGAAGTAPGAASEAPTDRPSKAPSVTPTETSEAATPHPLAGDDAWIAYQSSRSGSEGVWLVHPDGTEDHEIALDVPGDHLHPDWSPDGTRLVITSRTDRDVLYVVDLVSDAGEVLFECTGECLGDDEAVWSPEGTRIAFVRAMEPFVEDIPTCALFSGDVETGEVEQLGEARSCANRETFPHWSRDGSRIAYYRGTYEGDQMTSSALYVFDVASRQETKLTRDDLFAGDSDWSSDDEWIVFATFPLNDFQCCEVSNLYRIHPEGSGLQQLTTFETDELRATQPRYTPDGASIVFTAVTPSDRVPWVIPAGGGEPVAVAESGLYTHPAWQPGP